MKYFITTISKNHAKLAEEGGFIQVCHGKKKPLERMKKNDWVIIYSAKVNMNSSEKCQTLTAIGKVEDENIFSYKMTEGFIPFRRKIKFFSKKEISILPLIEKLNFIPNKKLWGYPFRYGILEIPENDFQLIKNEMGVESDE